MKTPGTLVLTLFFIVLATCAMNLADAQERSSKHAIETGNDLLRMCQSDDLFDRGVCGGYITAVSQMVQVANHACYSEGMTLEQGKDVVVRYLKDHPESRQLIPVTLAAKALTEAFPCKELPAK